ncbi:MAG: hypothetical protein Q9195_008635 [Heterodermia aff. obscurata]
MPFAPTASDLPPKDSPTIALVHPTAEERFRTWELNGSSWRGRLSLEAYLRREEYLASQPFSRDEGMSFWILVDTASTGSSRAILASCESFRKRALIKRPGEDVQEVVSHGIGSVFCNPEYRGRGYARRMMNELARQLDTWQQKNGEKAYFTVLYSDIGKEFYSKSGWRAFPSSHIALHPLIEDGNISLSNGELPVAEPLHAGQLMELCKDDEIALRSTLAKPQANKTVISVALIPDEKVIQWHHAREEFVANELLGKSPEIKGAIVQGEKGHRVWCLWTRTFGNEQSGNTMNILRLVIEGEVEEPEGSSFTSPGARLEESHRSQVLAATSVIQSACFEAAKWGMGDVQLWNPTPLTVLAAKKIDRSAEIVERADDSIASLRWHGPELDSTTELTWIGNEKYGWC